jgi:hypothetical protein
MGYTQVALVSVTVVTVGAMVYVPADGQTYSVVLMTLVTTVPEVETVA